MLFGEETHVWERAFNYGLPTVLLFAGCFALWRVALWARARVVEPVVDAHVHMMNTFSEEMPKQSEAIRGLKQSVDSLNLSIAELARNHEGPKE